MAKKRTAAKSKAARGKSPSRKAGKRDLWWIWPIVVAVGMFVLIWKRLIW